LNGTFDIDSITDDIVLRDVVKAMAHSNPDSPVTSDSRLTVEKLKEGFSLIKESTSSNQEGLHHGHWKTLIKDDNAFKPYALMIMFAFKWGNHRRLGHTRIKPSLARTRLVNQSKS